MEELTAAVSSLRSGPRLRHALAQVADAAVRDQLAAAVAAVVAEAAGTADGGEHLLAGQKQVCYVVPLNTCVRAAASQAGQVSAEAAAADFGTALALVDGLALITPR